MNIRMLKAVLIFGAIWGIIEATLGGLLMFFPYRGAIMSNIGLALIAGGISSGKNYRVGIYMGVVASFLKLTDSFIFGIPIISQAIIAPASAIIIESLAFSVVLNWMGYLEHKKLFVAGPVANIVAFIVISLIFVPKGFVENWGMMLLKLMPAIGISAFVCPVIDYVFNYHEEKVFNNKL